MNSIRKVIGLHRGPERIRISTSERIAFTKRLALYLRSGIPIREALLLITEDGCGTQNVLIKEVIRVVEQGFSLSRALSSFPRAYKPFHIQLIALGEATGTLSDTLIYLSVLLEERARTTRKVISALVYPIIVLLGTMVVSGFLILFAFPKIVPLFRSFHAKLPLSTRLLLATSDLFGKHGIALSILGICIVGGCFYSLRVPKMATEIQSILLRIPIIADAVRTYYVTTIFRMLSVLLASGMRIDVSLSLVKESISHYRYKSSIASMEDSVLRGTTLSESIRVHDSLYPVAVRQIITAGEITGTLSSSAKTVADIYEEQLSEFVQTLSSLLEPALMISMGLVVGFVAFAIITPMYSLTQSIHG